MTAKPLHPRKPFVARGSNILRCDSCLMPAVRCICSYRVEVEASARFWLLTHRKEVYKPTNTGRLILDTIAGSEVFEWSRTEPEERFLERLGSPEFDPYIVFPSAPDYADRMVEFEAKPGREPVFIILDGTWRQARRMFRHSRYLDRVPVIEPRTTRQTRYDLRTQVESHHLCTAEVAAAMLEQIGDHTSAGILDAYFEVFNEYYHASRRTRALRDLEAPMELLALHRSPK
ncbi:DTW domain-containing protein [Marinobacterium nitratireducens]|uniref:tRNA-uridine aminocarboxypropyltransferase n=1 Tax=Marinobacterium nitratireducens TaxID=518897 RepID=A0A917ZPG3_9GAMM|nr:DTW domain-containing protein [Marinobacterium nitratireducens]GGO88152.1 DTW domain-containing protein [Marinobacterium nitratireducens]